MKYSLSIEYLSSLDFESPNPGKNLANGEHAWMVAEDWLLGDMARPRQHMTSRTLWIWNVTACLVHRSISSVKSRSGMSSSVVFLGIDPSWESPRRWLCKSAAWNVLVTDQWTNQTPLIGLVLGSDDPGCTEPANPSPWYIVIGFSLKL